MNELQIFSNSEFGSVRTIETEGQIWFCGKDSALALGYANTQKAIKDHCKTPGVTICSVGVQTGTKVDGTPALQKVEMKFINEPNLYRLITHSKLPAAEKFERWIFEEVLPAIRRTGRYEMSQAKQHQPTRPLTTDDYMEAAKTIARCDNRRLAIVIDQYQKAGLDIQLILSTEREQQEEDDLVKLLKRYSLNELCEILNICKTSLYYYRAGIHKPHPNRYKLIITTLKERSEKQWKIRL